MIFWKKWTLTRKCGPFMHDFLKNWTSTWKCGPFTHDFLKKGTSTWKCGPFTHDFLKKVDLNLKIVDLNAWGSAKRGPQDEKYGPLYVIFEKKGPWLEECGPLFCDFPKQKLLWPEKCGHLHIIIWTLLFDNKVSNSISGLKKHVQWHLHPFNT